MMHFGEDIGAYSSGLYLAGLHRLGKMYIALTASEVTTFMETQVIDPSTRIQNGWAHIEIMATCMDCVTCAGH